MLGFLIDIYHNIEHKNDEKWYQSRPLTLEFSKRKKNSKTLRGREGMGTSWDKLLARFFWILY